MIEGIFKVSTAGNSAVLILQRRVMFALDIVPGDQVHLRVDDNGVCSFRKFKLSEFTGIRSVGVITDKPEALKP